MTTSEAPPTRERNLRRRYTIADAAALTGEETRRFVGDGCANPQTNIELAWELLYRREPELYDRLASAERLHPAVYQWLPDDVDRIVEVGAGTGRLTLELLHRAREIIAIEPAAPLREILARKLSQADGGYHVHISDGFFDELPVPDGWADLVVACSAFTPNAGHGGDAGLTEMERVCRPGGCVAIVWPNHVGWLAERGYKYVSWPGEMFVDFASLEEAKELIEIFYPAADAAARRGDRRRVSFEELGVNPPRDIAFKVMPR